MHYTYEILEINTHQPVFAENVFFTSKEQAYKTLGISRYILNKNINDKTKPNFCLGGVLL